MLRSVLLFLLNILVFIANSFTLSIPCDLIKGDTKQDLLKLVGDYVSNSAQSRIVSSEIVIGFFDTHFSGNSISIATLMAINHFVDGRTFEENVRPFEELCAACFEKRSENFTDNVCSFILLVWKAPEYSNLFNVDDSDQLARIKAILSEVLQRIGIVCTRTKFTFRKCFNTTKLTK